MLTVLSFVDDPAVRLRARGRVHEEALLFQWDAAESRMQSGSQVAGKSRRGSNGAPVCHELCKAPLRIISGPTKARPSWFGASSITQNWNDSNGIRRVVPCLPQRRHGRERCEAGPVPPFYFSFLSFWEGRDLVPRRHWTSQRWRSFEGEGEKEIRRSKERTPSVSSLRLWLLLFSIDGRQQHNLEVGSGEM